MSRPRRGRRRNLHRRVRRRLRSRDARLRRRDARGQVPVPIVRAEGVPEGGDLGERTPRGLLRGVRPLRAPDVDVLQAAHALAQIANLRRVRRARGPTGEPQRRPRRRRGGRGRGTRRGARRRGRVRVRIARDATASHRARELGDAVLELAHARREDLRLQLRQPRREREREPRRSPPARGIGQHIFGPSQHFGSSSFGSSAARLLERRESVGDGGHLPRERGGVHLDDAAPGFRRRAHHLQRLRRLPRRREGVQGPPSHRLRLRLHRLEAGRPPRVALETLGALVLHPSLQKRRPFRLRRVAGGERLAKRRPSLARARLRVDPRRLEPALDVRPDRVRVRGRRSERGVGVGRRVGGRVSPRVAVGFEPVDARRRGGERRAERGGFLVKRKHLRDQRLDLELGAARRALAALGDAAKLAARAFGDRLGGGARQIRRRPSRRVGLRRPRARDRRATRRRGRA